MLAVVEVLQGDELQDHWLHQFGLQLAGLEAVVASHVAVADAEQPLHHFLRSSQLGQQQKLLGRSHEVGDQAGHRA